MTTPGNTEIRVEGDKLIVTRIYAAPRDAVFEAWVETSKVQQWWGCAATTSVRSDIERCVGGKFDHRMVVAGVGEVPMNALITEYDPPKRLAYAIAVPDGAPKAGTPMTVSVDFSEVEGGTRVRLVHAGIPAEFRDMIRAGWTAGLEKLERFLASPARSSR
jgi:uncharacterized protein YndB with AHSA1/START domain